MRPIQRALGKKGIIFTHFFHYFYTRHFFLKIEQKQER